MRSIIISSKRILTQIIGSILLLCLCNNLFAQEAWVTGGQNADTAGGSEFTGPTVGADGGDSTDDSDFDSAQLSNLVQQRMQHLANEDQGNTALNGLHSVQSQLPNHEQRGKNTSTNLRGQAFSNLVSNALPMTPEEIVKLHSLFNATQRAASTIPGVPPRPVSRTVTINLSPGATPPVVRLYAGFVSTLVFVDSTGAPWPIEAYDLGNPKAFNISWNRKNNMLMIQALTLATVANLMVKLRTQQTPVMITLVPDQQAVDYRVDLRVPGLGPEANAMPSGDGLPDAANPVLLNILNGIAPLGSKVLHVTGASCQAWLIDHKLYLRSRFKVISPGWLASMTSADGTNAYELQRTPYVLLTGHGKTIPIRISGF